MHPSMNPKIRTQKLWQTITQPFKIATLPLVIAMHIISAHGTVTTANLTLGSYEEGDPVLIDVSSFNNASVFFVDSSTNLLIGGG